MDRLPEVPSSRLTPTLVLRQKRAHHKSRNGCVTCKKRRVKCDETLPQCKVCSRRGIHCKYAEPEQTYQRSKSDNAPIVCFTPNPSRNSVQTAPSSHQDLPKVARKAPDALLWQYYLAHAGKTIATTSTDPGHTRMWVTSIPAIAFSNSVTSHAMMAFSALCLSASSHMTDKVYDFRATARLHYCQSVNFLRTAIPHLHEISADALLACAMILIPCGLALSQIEDGFFELHDWLHHLRGWRILGSTIYKSNPHLDSTTSLIPYPQQGIPDPVFLPKALPGSTCLWTSADPFVNEIDRTRRKAMADLRCKIEALCSDCDPTSFEAYIAAIGSLEYVMDYVLQYPVSNLFRAVFTWPIHITPMFIQLLVDHDSVAQAIYAHWLVLTLVVENLWWVKGFGSSQIGHMAGQFEFSRPPGCELLKWPVEMRDEWRNWSSRLVVQQMPG